MSSSSPWNPVTNPKDLAVLGKLAEETNELGAATARCIIQGIGECEPVTKKPNREWLEDEIADVIANLTLTVEHFELDGDRIFARAARKQAYLKEWHKAL